MSFRIRTKLIIAFLAIIFPFMVIAGIISLYNLNIILKGAHKVEAITGEMHKSHRLQLALDMALMPVNDYIITGEKRYVEGFQKASVEVERWLKELEGELAGLEGLFPAEVKEEREILKDARASWQKIREISSEIFAIQNPVGNSDAAALMEETDYKWAYPAIEGLRRWQEIDEEEYREAHEGSERALRKVVIVMIAGGIILLFFGGSFAVFYSRIFVRPIEAIHESADAIATGDFKTRLDIRTGDEIQQLANAMNEMAAQLDSLTSNLQGMVEERTRELKESEERYKILLKAVPDIIFRLNKEGVFLDFKGEERELYVPREVFMGKKIPDVLPEEISKQVNYFMERAIKTGDIQTFEYQLPMPEGIEDYEARLVAAEDGFLAIVRNITERKKAEEKIEKQLDFLQRFEKVAVGREFRIKELRDENDRLKARISEIEKRQG